MRDELRANNEDYRIEHRANIEELPLELKANNTESGEARGKREGLPVVNLFFHDVEMRRAERRFRVLLVAFALTVSALVVLIFG